ncbi:MAG: glycosyltransferase [Bacteroidales bacterium]|nr:glycosyltransferase [Bacteroidales bacterium]
MKKIFIIAPHFPPSALPPSQRVRLMVKHLKSLGWYPHVFTTEAKYREEKEDAWMTELAGNDFDLTVVKALNQKKTRKFGIGDLGLRMIPYLLPAIKKAAKKEKPDFILYPVPPWYILLIAPRIKRKTGIPYGIDFIDPWFVGDIPKDANFKKRISQKIARKFEKKAVLEAAIIYSVSEGINNNLESRYYIENKPLLAIPYGVEPSDFYLKAQKSISDKVIFRYIGAVWNNAYLVLEPLLKSLSEIEKDTPLEIGFFGTSYAGEGLAKQQTFKWIEKFGMQSYMTENPLRVSYKKAVELTLSADIILLFGGMQPYYAASKLMGLIASGKPFIAFLHNDSFPAKFLKQLNYKYIVTYSQKELPETKLSELKNKITDLINQKDKFVKFDLSNPLIQKHTALGMTKEFVKPVENLLKKNDKP